MHILSTLVCRRSDLYGALESSSPDLSEPPPLSLAAALVPVEVAPIIIVLSCVVSVVSTTASSGTQTEAVLDFFQGFALVSGTYSWAKKYAATQNAAYTKTDWLLPNCSIIVKNVMETK